MKNIAFLLVISMLFSCKEVRVTNKKDDPVAVEVVSGTTPPAPQLSYNKQHFAIQSNGPSLNFNTPKGYRSVVESLLRNGGAATIKLKINAQEYDMSSFPITIETELVTMNTNAGSFYVSGYYEKIE